MAGIKKSLLLYPHLPRYICNSQNQFYGHKKYSSGSNADPRKKS